MKWRHERHKGDTKSQLWKTSLKSHKHALACVHGLINHDTLCWDVYIVDMLCVFTFLTSPAWECFFCMHGVFKVCQICCKLGMQFASIWFWTVKPTCLLCLQSKDRQLYQSSHKKKGIHFTFTSLNTIDFPALWPVLMNDSVLPWWTVLELCLRLIAVLWQRIDNENHTWVTGIIWLPGDGEKLFFCAAHLFFWKRNQAHPFSASILVFEQLHSSQYKAKCIFKEQTLDKDASNAK